LIEFIGRIPNRIGLSQQPQWNKVFYCVAELRMMNAQGLVEQARQGQPQAIAALINHSLKSRGIQATVDWSGRTLQVMLMIPAASDYAQTKLVSIIRRGLMALESDRIVQVVIYAKRAGEFIPLWNQRLDLSQASAAKSTPEPRSATLANAACIDHPVPPRRSRLHPNDFRVSGEQAILIGSVLVAILLALALLRFNLVLFVGALLGIAILVKVQQSQYLGRAVKIQPYQFPEIHQAAMTAANRLAMPMPDVFLVQSPDINAFALGFLGRKKTVVLHSALVEAMTWDELVYVLGHEFAHIKCNHTSFSVLTNTVENIVRIPVLSQVMGLIFLFWSRKCEYTCDRGGLLANQNLEAAVTALAKLAVGKELFHKMDIAALLKQKSEIERDGLSQLSEVFETHPYTIYRIHALQRFYDSVIYERIA
jgi:Zn-dependent protease with chaperone function